MTTQDAISWQKAFKKTCNGVPENVDEACDRAILALEKEEKIKHILSKNDDLSLIKEIREVMNE